MSMRTSFESDVNIVVVPAASMTRYRIWGTGRAGWLVTLCCGWERKVEEHWEWKGRTFRDGLRRESICSSRLQLLYWYWSETYLPCRITIITLAISVNVLLSVCYETHQQEAIPLHILIGIHIELPRQR